MTEIVRRTKLGGSEIVTVKSEDPFLLRPYQTYAVTDGVCGRVCNWLALNYHENLVKAVTKQKGHSAVSPTTKGEE